MQITEIYQSIQGESTFAGQLCTFVRTNGCNLRCHWCDSSFSFYGGQELTLDEIVRQVDALGCGLVELTGGEPLLQRDAPALVTRLLDAGHTVLIETSGSLDIRGLDPRAILIMDVKCPGSGMADRMHWENLAALRPQDQTKFVIGDRVDYDWAVDVLQRYPHLLAGPVLFAPVFGALEPQQLAEWILADRLSVRLQLQLHKYIWHPEARGV